MSSAKIALQRFNKTGGGSSRRFGLPGLPRLSWGWVRHLKNPHALGALALIATLGVGYGLIEGLGDPSAGKPKLMLKLAPEVKAVDPRMGAQANQQQQAITELDLLSGGRPNIASLAPLDDIPLESEQAQQGGGPKAIPGFSQVGGPNKPGVATITVTGAKPRVETISQKPSEPLPAAPIAGLTQPGPAGPLPSIGPKGEWPADAYARPYKKTGKPMLSVIVGGLGLNKAATKAAIERLPPEITLSFVPYAEGLQGWIDLARANGHEVILELPMEPFDYPENDPGPYTLLADAQLEENQQRLDWLMSRATGYFGVINYLGGKFMSTEAALAPIFQLLKQRGVAFVGDGQTTRSTFATAQARTSVRGGVADRLVDERPSAEAIDQQLLALEALALQQGHAMGVGFAYPITVDQIARWADGLGLKGYSLAPASAVVKARSGS